MKRNDRKNRGRKN